MYVMGFRDFVIEECGKYEKNTKDSDKISKSGRYRADSCVCIDSAAFVFLVCSVYDRMSASSDASFAGGGFTACCI